MSDGDLPDLPPDIAALLREARDVPPPPPSERRKVAARLALTTGLAIPGASLAGAKLLAGAWVVRAVGLAVAVAALGGVAVGTLRHAPSAARSTARAARVVARPAPPPAAPVVARSVPAPVAPPVAPAVAVAPTPPAAPPRPAAAPRPVDDSALDAELALIERAHRALSHDDTVTSQAALDHHARQHPRGRLTPEREALRVQCLAASGDRDGAEAARTRFHQRFPASVLGAAVDRAVDAAP